jgi:regulatory protein
MKVTNIKQQVKKTDRYSIFIDNKYSFSLSEAELVGLKLRVGQALDAGDLDDLNGEVLYSNAKNSCFKLLSYRARSTGEVVDYLKRKHYESELIDRVIEFLTTKKFIDDEQFARQWVENRLTIKQASIRQIISELRQKKVDPNLINKVIEEQSIDETKQIKQLIDKKRSQPKYRDDLKLMQYLSRKGFSYDKILVALGRRAE